MTCPQCQKPLDEPGSDPDGPYEPCHDPMHKNAYDVAHGARWITKEDS